jgi:hypothetical protein
MTRINKSAFNVREKLTELGRRFGLKGSELAAAETVQDARDLVSAGRKNMVINGDMRIFQRNNAGNVPNVGTYYLDRFQARENSEGVLYVTQQSSSSGGPPGFRSWLLAQCDGADTTVDSNNYVRIQQYIEGYNCFMDWGYGNTDYVTASFWVKSNKTGIYCFQIEDGDASPLYCQEYSIDQPDVWQKVVLTIPPPSTGTWRSADSGIGARLTWTLMAGSGHPTTAKVWQTSYGMRTNNQVNFMDNANNNFYLTGVQLEVGKNATDFEYRSYAEELALCQRYFYTFAKGETYNIIANGFANTSTNALFHFQHPVPMRTVPTTSGISGSWQVIDGQSHNVSSFSAATDATISTARVDASTSGLTIGRGCMLRNNNDVNATFGFVAEL